VHLGCKKFRAIGLADIKTLIEIETGEGVGMTTNEKPDSTPKLVFRTTDADFDIECIEFRDSMNRFLSRLVEKDSKPLNRALTEVNRQHGVKYAGGNIGIWGLVNSNHSYPHLIDTLIEHFQLPYMLRNRIAIARALMCREAQNTDAPVLLMQELKKLHSPQNLLEESFRPAIVLSLEYNGDNRLVEDTKSLIDDERYADIRKELEEMLKIIEKRKFRPEKAKS
jgi:hypothetical protein